VDIQLQELIEKIKKEGIESAQAEATKIKANAEAEAKEMVEQAKHQADNIMAQCKADAQQSEKSGMAALEQASRNLLLGFKGEIQTLLDKLVSDTINSAYSIEVIKEILPDLIKNWAAKNTDSLSVLLPEKEIKRLDDAFKANLVSKLKGGVEIKVGKNIETGFVIAEKDGKLFYDFSAEAVANMLSVYLNSKLAEILKKAV
jgi:V/A-type H+-transporting ATPase subunit E